MWAEITGSFVLWVPRISDIMDISLNWTPWHRLSLLIPTGTKPPQICICILLSRLNKFGVFFACKTFYKRVKNVRHCSCPTRVTVTPCFVRVYGVWNELKNAQLRQKWQVLSLGIIFTSRFPSLSSESIFTGSVTGDLLDVAPHWQHNC